ncbi:LptA/OstA family protein [Athalassotoga sp.]|uniref:LptA/OstA family protein n=1 Tax=Athalassotoga sp. TaxID=2022597 RepID=UPI003D071B27
MRKLFIFWVLILALSVVALTDTLHIIAGEVNYGIGSTQTTITNGKVMIGNTTIIATSITIMGQKDLSGNVNWTTAQATGRVFIYTGNATATARSMIYNLNTNVGTLSGMASMTINASGGQISIQSSTLQFNTKTNFYTGQGSPTVITKKDIYIQGKQFSYDSAKNYLDITGNVYLYNSSTKEKAYADELVMDTSNNKIVLKKVQMEIMVGAGS